MPDRNIEDLIEASSLGTPRARRLRQRTLPDVGCRIVERSKQIGRETGPGSTVNAETPEPRGTAPEPAQGA